MPLDKQGVWTLHFSYLPPRIVTVDTPTGKRIAWYMVYKVWNTSDTPVTVMPTFELVTKDGVLTSFLAREVFVSTMSVLAGGQADAEVDEGVVARIRTMTRDNGTLVFSPSAAAAALVFFVLAMQCLPTLTVTRKETGSLKYAGLQLAYMSSLAYVVALVVHQGLQLAGVP